MGSEGSEGRNAGEVSAQEMEEESLHELHEIVEEEKREERKVRLEVIVALMLLLGLYLGYVFWSRGRLQEEMQSVRLRESLTALHVFSALWPVAADEGMEPVVLLQDLLLHGRFAYAVLYDEQCRQVLKADARVAPLESASCPAGGGEGLKVEPAGWGGRDLWMVLHGRDRQLVGFVRAGLRLDNFSSLPTWKRKEWEAAQSIAGRLAARVVERLVAQGDFSALRELLRSLEAIPGIEYAGVVDGTGQIAFHPRSELVGRQVVDLPVQRALNDIVLLAETDEVQQAVKDGGPERGILDVAELLTVAGRRYGILRLGFHRGTIKDALYPLIPTVKLWEVE